MIECTTEEKTLINSYKKDFHERTGGSLIITIKSPWKAMCDIELQLEFEQLVDLILDANGWERKVTFSKKRTDILVSQRQIIDLILYCNGFGFLEIGRRTKRDHTTILYSVNNGKYQLEKEFLYQQLIREIVSYIKENAPLLQPASPVEA